MGNRIEFRTRSSPSHRRREHGRTLLVAMTVVTLAHVGILTGIWRESRPEREVSSEGNGTRLVEATMLPSKEPLPSLSPQIKRSQPSSRQTSVPTQPSSSADPVATAVKNHEVSAIPQSPETNDATGIGNNPTLSALANDPPHESLIALHAESATAGHADELAVEAKMETPTAVSSSIDLPAPTQFQYDVTGTSKNFNYAANATINWQRDGDRYAIEMKLQAFLLGSRSQVSSGLVTASGLQPVSFADKARRERRILFDWSQKTAQTDDHSSPIPIPEHTQDRLSVFFQLAAKLAPHRLDVSGARQAQWEISVTGWNGVEIWSFAIQDVGQSELPYGKLETWQVSRLPRPGKQNDQSVDVWYAPSLDFMPVRIRITQSNGDTVDQRLSRR